MKSKNRKPREKLNALQKLALFIPVWVQMIICAGGVVTAFVSSPILVEKFFATATPSMPAIAQPDIKSVITPSAVDVSTNTAAVPVDALVPLPGDDWAENCINSVIWKPYLAGETVSEQSGCEQLSEWGIKAEHGKLIFASNHYSQSRANEYGIMTPWRDWTEVDFTVVTERLEHSEMWFGFFEGDTPDSTGIIFVIQNGDEIDIRSMPNESEVVNNIDLKYAEGKFHPRINFEGGEIAVLVDGQGIISKWPINFTIRNMFIGYRALPSTNLSAAVSDLKFIPLK